MADTKKILVTLSVVEIEVPEDATDEQIEGIIEETYNHDSIAPWSTWTYADSWRN